MQYDAWYEKPFTNVFTHLVVSFDLGCELPATELQNVTVQFTASKDLPATFERLGGNSDGLFSLVRAADQNEENQALAVAAPCVAESLESAASVRFLGVALEQLRNARLKKVVLRVGSVFSHRAQGWSCHLGLALWAGLDLFFELGLCLEAKFASPWPRLQVSALQLPILKQSSNFHVELATDSPILAGDLLAVSLPAELHTSTLR